MATAPCYAARCCFGSILGALRNAVDDEANKVDEEEVVCVPENLKVVPPDELGGGRDHEDERQRDDDPGQPRDGGEGHVLHGLQGWQRDGVSEGTGQGAPGSRPALTVWLEWMGFSHLLLFRCILERMAARLPSVACWLSL